MLEIIQVIQQQYRKRLWLHAFSQSPNLFIKDWFEAYSRDNEVRNIRSTLLIILNNFRLFVVVDHVCRY